MAYSPPHWLFNAVSIEVPMLTRILQENVGEIKVWDGSKAWK